MGSATYGAGMPYNVEANTFTRWALHVHAPPVDRQGRRHGRGSRGVSPGSTDYKDYCIMSYQKNVLNFYDYCGRCNLKLRGWDTSPIAKNV